MYCIVIPLGLQDFLDLFLELLRSTEPTVTIDIDANGSIISSSGRSNSSSDSCSGLLYDYNSIQAVFTRAINSKSFQQLVSMWYIYAHIYTLILLPHYTLVLLYIIHM